MTVSTASWWSTHGSHTVLLGGPVAVIALVALGADVRAWLRCHPRDFGLLPAAVLSAVAAVVHGAVCPEHFSEGLVYGSFFAVTATGQLGWAILASTRVRPWLATAGVAGNAALLSLWTVTRTAGIPLGPQRGEVEAVGLLDVLASVAELGVVTACVLVLLRLRSHGKLAPAVE